MTELRHVQVYSELPNNVLDSQEHWDLFQVYRNTNVFYMAKWSKLYSVLYIYIVGPFRNNWIPRWIWLKLAWPRSAHEAHVSKNTWGSSMPFPHNSAPRAKHRHVGPYLSDLRCIVIGQYAMGRSLMDRSIACALQTRAQGFREWSLKVNPKPKPWFRKGPFRFVSLLKKAFLKSVVG